MTSNTPPFLKKGDKITIVAPARAVEAAFIESAVATIEKAGYKAVTATNLFEKENQFAGSDESRAADLNAAIGDEECRAILCARGGYGTARLLSRIDWGAWAKDPKWLIGYSDVTALHSALHQLLGMQSVHGTMPVNFTANTPDALGGLFAVLRGEEIDVTFEPHRLNRSGECVGDMVGGNLSVLYSMLGSETQLDTKGKILFLEDLDEYLYHVDRMMLALDRAGMLRDLAGLVVGGMTDMNDNAVPFGSTAEEIIADRVRAYGYPVAFGYPSGHIDDNRAWIHGKKRRLTVHDDQPSSLNHY